MHNLAMRMFLTGLVMAFSLFGATTAGADEAGFWKWFVANESRLFAFESNQEAVFKELSTQLSRVNDDLTFELGPVHDGKREFVISAGGMKRAFPAVEALYSQAPSLPRWTWVKFRPRRLPINDLEFAGKPLKADDVHYMLVKDEDKVGIVLFLDGYNDAEKNEYGQMGYLFLDEALGEYAVETQVGFVDFLSRESKYFKNARPLKELPAQFDEYWVSRTQ